MLIECASRQVSNKSGRRGKAKQGHEMKNFSVELKAHTITVRSCRGGASTTQVGG